MSAQRAPMTTAARDLKDVKDVGDVEHAKVAASPQAQRRRRSRFLRVVLGITVLMHLPVALGVAALVGSLGAQAPIPALVGWGGPRSGP